MLGIDQKQDVAKIIKIFCDHGCTVSDIIDSQSKATSRQKALFISLCWNAFMHLDHNRSFHVFLDFINGSPLHLYDVTQFDIVSGKLEVLTKTGVSYTGFIGNLMERLKDAKAYTNDSVEVL